MITVITSCAINNDNNEKSDNKPENLTTIVNKTGSTDIGDYSAEVMITSENSRIAGSESILSSYQLSTKIIDNQLYTRIDYPESEGYYRTAIATPYESVIFDRTSNEVLHRADAPSVYSKKVDTETLFDKVDINEVRSLYNKLSFRTTENIDDNLLTVDFPAEILNDYSVDGESVLSNRISYDLTTGMIAVDESESITADNVKVKRVVKNTYKDVNGIPVLVKSVEQISYDFPYTIDTSDRALPTVNSMEEIPEISQDELDRLISEGAEAIYADVIIGDPSDPDYTETITTTYKDIELNSLSKSYFKVNL